MGIKQSFIVLFIPFFCLTSFAQEEKDIIYEEKTTYKESYPNRITARAFYVNTSNSLRIKDRNSSLSFDLEPNKQNRIGASVSFRGITISYSFTPDFLAENKDNENSKLFSLNFRTFFGKHFMQTFDLFNEKGFYLIGGNNALYLPKTNNFKIGGATSYIINENFSFRAITSQDEKQLKSTGSFIPRIMYYYSRFNLKYDSSSGETSSNYYSFDLAFAPSYYYNFVPTKNLMFSAGVSAGIGMNHSKTTGEDALITLLTELNFRGSATYDIDNFYIGTHYSYLILDHNVDRSSHVVDNIPFFQVFLGYRFRAPKKLVKKADEFSDKLKSKIKKDSL